MAFQNFVKTVWIASLMKSLEKAHVYAGLANREYEGQLNSLGDKVRMLSIGDITSSAYAKDVDIAAAQDLQDAADELVADRAYSFNFKANDVDAVQAKPTVLSTATQKAAYAFRDDVDKFFASLHAKAGLQVYSTGITPYDINSLNVEDILAELGEKMSDANIPEEGRWLVIPNWFHTKLILAGLATKSDNTELYNNGFIKRLLNFDLYKSNNVSQTSSYTDVKIIGGVKNESLTFADVISTIEPYRPEKRFEDAVKGLYVFGGKVARPDKTICLHATRIAEP